VSNVSPETALTRLGESTAQAIASVLEQFCPGEVKGSSVLVLPGKAEPLADFPAPLVATTISYVDGVTGGNVLVLTLEGARRLAAAMMGMPSPEPDPAAELDEMALSAVSEAMNQMMAAAAGATTEVLGTEVEISPPETRIVKDGEPVADLCPPSPHAVSTTLNVLGEPARLVQFVPSSFTARMTAALDDLGFELTVRDDSGAAGNVPQLGGITMRLSAELGRTHMPAGKAVGLPTGSVIELDADVDAPIDLYVNGVRFATGRLLVTEDGDWAVEVLDVLEQQPASTSPRSTQGDPA
jgi:flagellar motor switch protein FliN